MRRTGLIHALFVGTTGGFLIAAWLQRSFPLLMFAGSVLLAHIAFATGGRRQTLTVLSALAFAFGAADLVVGVLGPLKERTYYERSVQADPLERANPKTASDLGYQPKPGTFRRQLKEVGSDAVLWDVTVTHSSDGFRATPNPMEHPHGINLFGGSFAYGTGLNDDETLAYFLQNETGLGVRNYGVFGYGLHQALAIMQRSDSPTGTINVVLTLPFHATRSACTSTWSAGSPRFELVDGELARNGTCETLLPPPLGEVIDHSNIVRLVRHHTANRGTIGLDELELHFALVEAMNDLSRKRSQALVIAHIDAEPGTLPKDVTNDDVRAAFAKRSDLVVDVSLLDDTGKLANRFMVHPLDGHPSAEANHVRAQLILEAMAREGLL